MNLYRVRLTCDSPIGVRSLYVDIEAVNPADAVAWALKANRNAVSAQCLGLASELEAKGKLNGSAVFKRADSASAIRETGK